MISVIIPCYNSGKHIKRAIESVLAQTYTDYEILLVNNNSIDNTINIMRHYCEKYPNVFKILHETKKGAPAARNKGLYEAKGEWVQYLDADDELMPDKLARQLKILIENGADIIAGSFVRVNMGKTKIRKTIVMPNTKNAWLSLISSTLGKTSSMLWKRQALIAINGWNEMLSSSQEYDLLFRALKRQAVICFDTKPSTFIYITRNSLSNTIDKERNSEIFNNWVELRLAIKKHLKENGLLSNKVNQTIDTVIFNYLNDREHLSPIYVTNKLRDLTLNLPFNLRVKRLLFLLKAKMTSNCDK